MQIIAHRGASADFPENTELSFVKALEFGADGVECDIRPARCGTLMCIHDPRIDRLTEGTGLVSRYTAAELSAHNFGTEKHPQPPLPLDQLLEIMEAHPSKHLFIETKHFSRFGRIVEEQLVLRLRYFGMLDRPTVHVISFSPLAMRRMHQLAPTVDRIYLLSPRGRYFKRWGSPAGYGASISDKQPAHYLWTVDDPVDMLWAAQQGTRYLATNKPGLARQVLGRQETSGIF